MQRQSNTQVGTIVYISYVQIIGIILVVIGHSLHEYPDMDMGRSTLLYRMIYSFHMPLFLFVSGFLMVYSTIRNGKHISIRRFTLSKIKRLIVPFLVLTAVTFVPRAMLSTIADEPVELSFKSFLHSFIYTHNLVIPYFWYIQVCFTLLVVNYAILMIGKRIKLPPLFIYSGLVILFLVLPLFMADIPGIFSIHLAIRTGIYFVAGAAYARYYTSINKHLPRNSIYIFAICAMTWATLFAITENTEFFPLCTFVGIVMCLSLAGLLEQHDMHLLDHLEGANFIIFLLSWYMNIAAQQLLHHFVSLPWWIYSLLSIFAGIYIPWAAYRYMCSNPRKFISHMGTTLLGQRFRC